MMMPPLSDWEEVPLGSVVNLKRGYDLPSKERRDGIVPIVSSSGITGFHDEVKVPPPGVVTGRTGTLGQVFFVEEGFWPLNTTLYVQDFKGNDPRWVSYLLGILRFGERSSAAAVPGVNRNALHRLPVLRPPVRIQQKIASILSAYDLLIENNTRRIQVLEDIARAIYREWFVQFRFPGHEGVSLFESELGPIPEEWRLTRVDQIADIVRGRSYKGTELVEDGGLPLVNLKCVRRDGGFRLEGLKRYSGKFKEEQKTYPGDIVMAVTDMTQERRIVARAARVPAAFDGFSVISMDLVKVAPGPGIGSSYLLGVLGYSSFPDDVKNFANGANVLHLSPERIGEYRLALPPAQLREAYDSLASRLHSLSDSLLMATRNLRATRDLLLPRLISGEVDVSDVEVDTSGLVA